MLRRQTSRSHYGSKAPAVTTAAFKYKNKIGKLVVKAVPYSVTVRVARSLVFCVVFCRSLFVLFSFLRI